MNTENVILLKSQNNILRPEYLKRPTNPFWATKITAKPEKKHISHPLAGNYWLEASFNLLKYVEECVSTTQPGNCEHKTALQCALHVRVKHKIHFVVQNIGNVNRIAVIPIICRLLRQMSLKGGR